MVLVVIAAILAVISGYSEKEKNQLIEQIERYCLESKPCDKYDLEDEINRINEKRQIGKELTSEEHFVLGFHQYVLQNYNTSLEEFISAMTVQKNDTNTFVKVGTGYYINSILKSEDRIEDGVSYLSIIMDELTPQEWNEEIDIIMCYLNTFEEIEKGRTSALKILNTILQSKNWLDPITIINIESCIANFSMYNTNYALALEKNYSVVSESKKIREQYFLARATADLGVTYFYMGDLQSAQKYLEDSLKVEITDNVENANLKTYALIKLYQVSYCSGNYNTIFSVRKRIEKTYSYLSEEKVKSLDFFNSICVAGYYLVNKDVDSAKVQLENAETIIGSQNMEMSTDSKLLYYITLADYNMNDENYQVAVTDYVKALDLSNQTYNYIYKKCILKKMAELYRKSGQTKLADNFSSILESVYDEELRTMNESISQYAKEKYDKEVTIYKLSSERIKKYSIALIAVMVFIVLVVIFYMKLRSLENLNKLDGLTKSFNRGHFNKKYREYMSRKQNFYLIMFDIDNFKILNDTFGHVFGDKVLKEIVKAAKSMIGIYGEIFRYGGEEFVVLIKYLGEEEVVRMAEELRNYIENRQWDEDILVTISVGIAGTSEERYDILEDADRRLYFSKKNGKNRITYQE